MAGGGFKIELTAESQKKLNSLAKAGNVDLRPVFVVMGKSYREEVKLIFDNQQPREAGLRWKPLTQRYEAWKARHFLGKPILQRSGDLFASMTKKGVTGNIELITKTHAVFGSSIKYAAVHDEGGKVMPQRNFSRPGEPRIKAFRHDLTDAIIHNFKLYGISVTGEILK